MVPLWPTLQLDHIWELLFSLPEICTDRRIGLYWFSTQYPPTYTDTHSRDHQILLLHFPHVLLVCRIQLSATGWQILLMPVWESTNFKKSLKELFGSEQTPAEVIRQRALTPSVTLLYLSKFWTAVTAWAKTLTLSGRIEQIKKKKQKKQQQAELKPFIIVEYNWRSLNPVLRFASASNGNQNGHTPRKKKKKPRSSFISLQW